MSNFFLLYLNVYFLFKCFQKSKFYLSKDSWIFLVVGKYQCRAPKAYLSIYLDYASVTFGQMELWLSNALQEKNNYYNMTKNWSFAKIMDILAKLRYGEKGFDIGTNSMCDNF